MKVNIVKCPICLLEFNSYKFSNGKMKVTCSAKCSNKFFSDSKHSVESNLKRSKALNKYFKTNKVLIDGKYYFNLQCIKCKIIFQNFSNEKQYCSIKCQPKRIPSKEGRKAMSDNLKKLHSEGKVGWTTRKKLEPSYPEKYTISILDELHIKYEREFKCGKWFIDFADIDRKIALEIDGKQHELPERILSDKNKNEFLIKKRLESF